jgi:hypothetical protein
MRVFVIFALITVLTCNAQEPALPTNPPPAAQVLQDLLEPGQPSQSVPENAQESSPPPAKHSVTVPQGARIPLVLTTPINTRTTHTGDPVRAETAFPITISGQLVIPAGTYLEGQLTAVPAFQMRFTRLIFPSGYAVPLPGATAQAKLAHPATNSPIAHSSASSRNINSRRQMQSYRLQPAAFPLSAGPQQPPPPPPLPQLGPSRGEIIGIGIGGLAAVIIATVLVARHHQNQNDIYLNAGSQIELILQAPLTLDAESIAAASAPLALDFPGSRLALWIFEEVSQESRNTFAKFC